MNNTNHFGLTDNGNLVNLGVGAADAEVARLLADTFETNAAAKGEPVNIVTVLDIADLYRLRTQMADALNNLDNDALGGEPLTFGLNLTA